MARTRTARTEGASDRYRRAHAAGAAGRVLPKALAAEADADPLIDQAHDAGREGTDFDTFHRQALGRPAREERGRPSSSAGRSRRSGGRRGLRRPSRPSPRRPLGGITEGASPGHSLAGVALGAVAYALVLSVIDYGPKGPRLWFKAKFLNEPAAPPTTAKATTKHLAVQ